MGPKQIMCDCSKPNIFGKQYVGDALPGFCQLTFEKGCCGCCDLKIGTIIVAVLTIVFSFLGLGGNTWSTYLVYLTMAIGNLCFGVLAIIGSGCCTAPNWKFVHFFTMWQVFGLIWSIIGFIINVIVMITYTTCVPKLGGGETCHGIPAGSWIIMIGVTIAYCFSAFSASSSHTSLQSICMGVVAVMLPQQQQARLLHPQQPKMQLRRFSLKLERDQESKVSSLGLPVWRQPRKSLVTPQSSCCIKQARSPSRPCFWYHAEAPRVSQ